MFELVRRTRILMVVLSIALCFLIYFVIYRPMMSEIEHRTYLNITEISKSKYSAIQNALDASLTGSLSLSSRSAIRDKIAEYKDGTVTLDELAAFTQPKYTDGAAVLDNIVLAQRIVDGQLIASYQPDDDFDASDLAGTEDYAHAMDNQFIHSGDNLYVKVFSPIMQNGEEVGVDMVLFDFSEELSSQNDSLYSVGVIDSDEFNLLKEDSQILLEPEDSLLISKDQQIYFLNTMDDHYFLVQASQPSIFEQANTLTRNIIIAWIAIFAILLITVYLYIIRYANKVLKSTEQSRDEFKDMAYTDHMTRLQSRSYLEIWKMTLRDITANYSLVMVDIDNFKKINDRFGHLVGDEVLKRIADVFLSSIREGDVIVRYGGDECLLILKNTDEGQAQALIDRIGEKLARIKDFDFQLSVSSGISRLAAGKSFSHALNLADERMYASKAQKNSIS